MSETNRKRATKTAKPPAPLDRRDISPDNCINTYMHCALCLDEMPAGISPRDWARTQTGFTLMGIQIWCVRHECNIAHIDFRDQRMFMNSNRVAEA